jgi:hypothetical protein
MRHASINTRLAIAATLSILIGVAALVAYVSTSSYRMVAAIQENSLNQTARLIAQSAQNSIRDSVEVANPWPAKTPSWKPSPVPRPRPRNGCAPMSRVFRPTGPFSSSTLRAKSWPVPIPKARI